MNNPLGLAVNSAGNLFIADSGNNVIRGVISGVPTDGTTTVTPLDQNGNSSPATVTFAGVTQPGFTAVVIGPTAPALPANFVLVETPPVFFDIVTTAQYSGSVTVCIAISPIPPGALLLHFNQATLTWEDFTFVPTGSPSRICTTLV
jgi:hypothetical protein